jgi:hypothetical protein
VATVVGAAVGVAAAVVAASVGAEVVTGAAVVSTGVGAGVAGAVWVWVHPAARITERIARIRRHPVLNIRRAFMWQLNTDAVI